MERSDWSRLNWSLEVIAFRLDFFQLRPQRGLRGNSSELRLRLAVFFQAVQFVLEGAHLALSLCLPSGEIADARLLLFALCEVESDVTEEQLFLQIVLGVRFQACSLSINSRRRASSRAQKASS